MAIVLRIVPSILKVIEITHFKSIIIRIKHWYIDVAAQIEWIYMTVSDISWQQQHRRFLVHIQVNNCGTPFTNMK